MKRLFLSLLSIMVCAVSLAQTTKVRGFVTDAETGEAVPFAGVYFKGTTIGQSADIDGAYSIETRNREARVLVCQLIGYEVAEQEVPFGSFSTVNFKLKPLENRLDGVIVKADNKRARALLRNIDANRRRNDPDRRPQYSVEIYNKMEFDLTHAREQLKGRRFLKEFGFAFDYMDTSSVSGVPYLPVMISETIAQRYHRSNPQLDRETVIANKISGINPENNLLSQFSGEFHLRANFYKDFINIVGVEFPSPIQPGGLLYYNYFIIDSLQIDGRKTYQVRYHPKSGISSPAFDGEMFIDSEDYALRSIHAKMVRGGNVNWLRDLVMDTDYHLVQDSIWFYKSDRMYADFSVALTDSSKTMSFIGDRKVEFMEPSFEPVDSLSGGSAPVKVAADANFKTAEYWEEHRPYELSDKEKGISEMVERIKDQDLYHDLYTTIYTIVNGYWDIGPIGFGPYFKLVSFNNLEGFRPQLGIHTSKDFSQKFRWTVYGAYGTLDRQLKGGVTYERMFSKDPTRKLTLDAHHDVFQLGRGSKDYTQGNILSSMWRGTQKLSPMTSFSARYDHEFSQSFNAVAEVALKRYFANVYVPMTGFDGASVPSIASNEIHLQARFSRDETVNRGFFVKKYVHTFKPVLYFDVTGAVGGLAANDCSYLKPQFSFDYRLKIPPIGLSRIHFTAGTILGRVPYPFLNIYPGNVTGLTDNTSFSCMDFFEYASDSWAMLFWDHNFHGFFLGKIPLLRRLQLREVVTLKAAYGHLSEKNNGTDSVAGALMRFPEGMDALTVPYVEVGAGISNIMRLFRIEGFWRLTNLEHTDGTAARRPFVLSFGIDVRF